MAAEPQPTHISQDDLAHYQRAAARYALAKARFEPVEEMWNEELAAIATKYQITGEASFDRTTGAITRLPAAASTAGAPANGAVHGVGG